MEVSHQKNLVNQEFPFNLLITDIAEFPPHWHKEIEIIYVLEGKMDIGLNNQIYTMESGDILLVGMGDVHYFLTSPVRSNRIIVQFDLSMVEYVSPAFQDRRFKIPVIRKRPVTAGESVQSWTPIERKAHHLLEEQILTLHDEYQSKSEGYKLAVMARLYDLVAIFLRYLPMEEVSPLEKNKHLKKLDRLEQVFSYVEQNYARPITLQEVSCVANFSVYHFTRFFKETTGMTFLYYLNSYRISKAVKYLTKTADFITEVAFKSGFDSIKTFNRVFKQFKGCSPTQYQKQLKKQFLRSD